ncbi:MAG: hypothetical protein QF541_03350 [Lentisphaeria bacterium]|jgi:hypothetical protein|nr:hypothetical protein [Lentisphaeria bacterium]
MRLINKDLYTRSNAPPKSGGLIARGTAVKFLCVVSIIMLVALTKIYLERSSTNMGLIWTERHQELSQLIDEDNNLRMQREKVLVPEYIEGQALQLGLRSSDPEQVRRVDLLAYHRQIEGEKNVDYVALNTAGAETLATQE